MTCINYYPPREMSLPVKSGFDPGVVNNLAGRDFHSKSQIKRLAVQMEVTPEEEEAWLEKLHRMAGTHE